MIRRRIDLFALVIAVGAAGGAVWAQTMASQMPQRDSRVMTSGPGRITGLVVTDEETPRPIKRAEVRVIIGGSEPRTTYTDAAGAFTFDGLPMGRYTVDVNKPSYVRTAYGARRHDRPGTPIILADTQRTQTIQIRMARGSVITGRVVDEYGQPAQGARVRAQLARMVNGERVLSEVPLAGAILGEPADDRGVYRLYGLPAGEYVISAAPRSSGIGDIRRMTEQEIRAAEQAVKQPQLPLEPDSPPITLGYATMFYPGVLSPAQASTVTVKAGEERQGVDFAVQFVRTANVEGTLITPGGVRPETVELLLLPRATQGNLLGAGGPVFFAAGGGRRVGPDGKFSFPGVTPGPYTLSARLNQEAGGSMWARADVDVDGELVSGVTLSLQEGLTVLGRMAFEADGVDPPTLFTRARVNLVPAEGGGIMIGGTQTQIGQSGNISMRGVIPGRYRVTANFNTPEANWLLKSAIIKGKDALDVPVEIGPGDTISDAVLTFTNRTQELNGMLQDAAKRPAPDFTVVLFPADKALWSATRRIRSTRPDTSGRFTFGGIPAGAYRLAAVMDIGAEELRDQTLLEELLGASIAVTVADGEKKTQDIRLASGGSDR